MNSHIKRCNQEGGSRVCCDHADATATVSATTNAAATVGDDDKGPALHQRR